MHSLIGERFGFVIVESQLGRNMGRCDCICDCGNRFSTRRTYLLSGRVKSCGCKRNVVHYDLTGKRFGRLTVLGKDDTRHSLSGKSRMVMWKCECDCGAVKSVNSRALRLGSTLSCGCYQKEQVSNALSNDYINRRFGKLVVICKIESWQPKSGSNRGIKSRWLCQCDCGEFIEVLGTSLQCGDTRSCGCNKISKLEEFTEMWLQNNGFVLNESYFKQKTFDDLRGIGGGLMPYDFYVIMNQKEIVIECQGKQHYQAVDWFGGHSYFEKLKQHDRLKLDYAKKNNFDFIEVNYQLNDYTNIANYLVSKIKI